MVKLLILIDCIERYRFYARISDATIEFVTHRFGLFIYLKYIRQQNCKFIPISYPFSMNGKTSNTELSGQQIFMSREYCLGQSTYNELNNAAGKLKALISELNPDAVFAYNDQIALGAVLKTISKEIDADVRFHEISNFPGYMQCNAGGINTRTLINFSKRLENVNKVLIEKGKNLKRERNELTINPLKLLDAFFLRRPKLHMPIDPSLVEEITCKILSETSTRDTIVFVEQVVDDTNIVCNSKVNVQTLLEVAESLKPVRKVIWRPHPKQKMHISFSGTIDDLSLEDRLNLKPVIVTINSTVEVDARLRFCQVISLEKSIFTYLLENIEDPVEALSCFLGNCSRVDYFSRDSFSFRDLL